MNSKKLSGIILLTLFLSVLVPACALTGLGLGIGATETVAGPLHGERAYIKIVDPDAAFDALLTGEVDFVGIQRPDQIQRAIEAGFTVTKESVMGHYNNFYFHMQHNITNDLDFRKAVAHLLPKDELVATHYGTLAEYGVSFLGPAYGKWHNPNVEDFAEYDPDLAAYLLDQAGYTLNPATGIRINPATGEEMRTLDIVYPPDMSPQYTAFAERFMEELDDIGIPINRIPAPFSTGEWWDKTLAGDFDIYQIGWSWGGYPEVLYVWWASASPPEWLNIGRYSNPEVDYWLDIFHLSLNETAVVEAAWRVQEIVAEEVAYIPGIYSVSHLAYNPEWTGIIEAPWGSYTELLRMHPKDGDYSKTYRIRVTQEPATMVIGYDPHAIADGYVNLVCHNDAYESHPFNGPYLPWIVTDWELEPWADHALGVTNGTKLTLELKEGVKWHDGFNFTAEDYAFAAKYAKNKQIPRASMLIDKLIDAEATSLATVVLYYNKTSLFILDNQYYALAFPKHIYNDNVTLYGEPAGPMDLQFEGQYGVPDPSTFYAYKTPNPFNESLTCFVGTGPFIYLPGGFKPGVSFAVVANREYFKTILVTDVNYDFKVNILDIAAVTAAIGTEPGHPRWTVTVDLNGDNEVNIIDIATVCKDFGKTW